MSFPFYDRVQSGQLISRANSDIRSVQMYMTFAPDDPRAVQHRRGGLRLHAVDQRAAGLRGHGHHALRLPRRASDAEVDVPGVVADPGPAGRRGHHRRREHQRRPGREVLRRRAAAAAHRWPRRPTGRSGATSRTPTSGPGGRRPSRTCPRWAWPSCCCSAATWSSTATSASAPSSPSTPTCSMLQAPFMMLGHDHHDGPAGRGLGRAHLRDPRRAADHRRPARAPSTSSTAGATSRFDDVSTSPTATDGPAGPRPTSTCTCARARPWPWSGGPGSGKSTVARLLTRFYDVTGGPVRIDGHDVRDLTLESLRAHVGIVLDEPFLFSVSIRDNIAYGRPDADFADIEAAAAARPAPTSSSASCPTATTRSSASGATRSRAASASASPSPGRCSSTRRSSSSTTPPAPSTSRSSSRSTTRCASSWRAAPR